MDLDAVLARRPTIALVDELAHTNAPGSRNPKRYQDVEEILRGGHQRHHHAQHPAPGEPARHRRAGHRRAGQGAAARLRRHHGRPDRQRGPFGRGPARAARRRARSIPPSGSRRPWRTSSRRRSSRNCASWRWRRSPSGWTARGARASSGAARRPPARSGSWSASSSRSPRAAALLRKAARHRRPPGRALVRRLRADAPRVAREHRRRHAAASWATTSTWPGSWAAPRFQFKGADLVSTIAAFVKEYGITHIVLGRSRQPWYRRWFGRSVLDRLLQTIPGVDVIVVDNDSPTQR